MSVGISSKIRDKLVYAALVALRNSIPATLVTPYGVFYKAFAEGTQTYSGGPGDELVTMAAVRHSSGVAPLAAAPTTRFQVSEAGLYMVVASFDCRGGAPGGTIDWNWSVYRNGDTGSAMISKGDNQAIPPNLTTTVQLVGSVLLDAGDDLSLGFNGSGPSAGIIAGSDSLRTRIEIIKTPGT
jgi:hypothetical protein